METLSVIYELIGRSMKILGVTGRIGSGKSEVLKYLSTKSGLITYEADKVAHGIQGIGKSTYLEIVSEFGEEILDEIGNIDRKALGNIVFQDTEKLKTLNQIMHPAVKNEVNRLILVHEKSGCKLFVLEAALLLEENYQQICDEIWYIKTGANIRRERVVKNRNCTEEKFSDIDHLQLSNEAFEEGCDYVIDNTGTLESLHQKIDKELKRLLGETNEIM